MTVAGFAVLAALLRAGQGSRECAVDEVGMNDSVLIDISL